MKTSSTWRKRSKLKVKLVTVTRYSIRNILYMVIDSM